MRFGLLLLVLLAGCGEDWRSRAMDDARALVRQQLRDRSVRFADVQFTGDHASGQTCGYYETPYFGGGVRRVRFIVFIDGAGGRNPYIDDPSFPYPGNASDFSLNWREQCVRQGYSEPMS